MDTQLIQQEIETLKQYLQEPNYDNTEKVLFQKRIDELQLKLGAPQSESMLEAALNQFAQVMQTDAGLSEDEVIQISERVFATSQISMSQLSPEVIDAIDKTKQITININTTGATVSTSRATKTSGGQRRLFYVILSDVAANNNVYLYGPAGTGKTQMAKIVADALNYRVYVINCNQYTSPIEIVGGQTI
jgi:MoxR-like ATPase